MGGITSSNIFKFAQKLIKRQPYWKRVGNSNYNEFFATVVQEVGELAKSKVGYEAKLRKTFL